MNLDRLMAYNEAFFEAQLKEARIGAMALLIAFGLFLYADVHIFMYPPIIFRFRLALVIYFFGFFVMSFLPIVKEGLLRILYGMGVAGVLAFTTVLQIVLGTQKPEYYERSMEVYILVVLCMFFLAALVRCLVGYMMLFNLLVFLTSGMVIRGFMLESLFYYFNIIAYTSVIVVVNEVFIRVTWHNRLNEQKLEHNIMVLEDEVSKRKALEKKLKHMATYDELTNVYTRRVGFDMLAKLLIKAEINGEPLSICFVDINHLKIINDSFGHHCGDEYLNAFVKVFHTNCRESDLCIRVGGDEFLLVLPHTTAEKAEYVWEKISEGMRGISFDFDATANLSASHGIAEYYNSNYDHLEQFVQAADSLMYIEKKRTREYAKKRLTFIGKPIESSVND